MGTPAPYTNLNLQKHADTGSVRNSWAMGVVIRVHPSEPRAIVEVAGSQWTVIIPGSVHGVEAGRSVGIRTIGNIRQIESLITAIPKGEYNTTDKGQRSVDTPLAGTGGGTPSSPGGAVSVYNFSQYIPGFTVADAGSNSTAEINKSRLYIGRLVTRFTDDTSSALSAIHRSLTSLSNGVEANRQAINSGRGSAGTSSSSINDLRQNVDELRKVVETLSSDLREQGLVK